MKTLIEKLKSRKLLSTVAAYGLGVYLIRSGNVAEGIALITGAQASYNIGEGLADQRGTRAVTLTTDLEPIAAPVRTAGN